MILRYLLSSLFSRVVLPIQAENIMLALGVPAVKRGRTTNKIGLDLIHFKKMENGNFSFIYINPDNEKMMILS